MKSLMQFDPHLYMYMTRRVALFLNISGGRVLGNAFRRLRCLDYGKVSLRSHSLKF